MNMDELSANCIANHHGHDCDEFACFGFERLGIIGGHAAFSAEEFQPKSCFIGFLEGSALFGDEPGIRACSGCLTHMGRNGCARAQHLVSANAHLLTSLGQSNEITDHRGSEPLGPGPKLYRKPSVALHISDFSFPDFSFIRTAATDVPDCRCRPSGAATSPGWRLSTGCAGHAAALGRFPGHRGKTTKENDILSSWNINQGCNQADLNRIVREVKRKSIFC